MSSSSAQPMAVSLYDITSLSNPTPMVTRAEVSGSGDGWSWSEATWDHRAFTVLDNAVNVQAPTGETETGLVLLPFSVWTYNSGWRLISAVQIFTYSSTTLTRRGLMSHGTPVRRTFPADADHAANLSDAELSVYDQSDLDAPTRVASLSVAANFQQIFSSQNYRVRVNNPASPYWWWYNRDEDLQIEVIPRNQPAEAATPVASFTAPSQAKVFQKDELLVVVSSQYSSTVPSYRETILDVYDLSLPGGPQHVGNLTTTGLPELLDWVWHERVLPTATVAGDALVFLNPVQNWAYQGRRYECNYSIYQYVTCYGQEGCTYPAGTQQCFHVPGPDHYCAGGFAECTDHANSDTTCVPAEYEDLDGSKYDYCYNRWVYRSWMQFEFTVVDLSDPANPTLGPTITMPQDDKGISMLPSGDDLYVTVRRPTTVAGDPRPYVHYFAKRINLSDPSQPFIDTEINVPGEVLASNGTTLYTVDKVWGDQFVESAVAQVEVSGGQAHLHSYQRFAERELRVAAFDGQGLAVADHELIWRPKAWGNGWDPNRKLSVLGPRAAGGPGAPAPANPAAAAGFEVLSETRMPSWLSLRQVDGDRALMQVPAGAIIINLETPRQPRAQAMFPVYNWPREFLFEDGELLFAAEFYGIHQMDIDDSNLQPGSAP